MKIAIMMAIGSQNLGDELILKNEIKILKQKYGEDTQFRVFSYDIGSPFFEDEQVEYREYFPIDVRNPKNIVRNTKNYFEFIKTLSWCDLVVMGGGGIFFDSEKGNTSNPLSQWIFRSEIISKMKKDFIIYGVSIDVSQKESRAKIERIFSKAKEVYVRDENSRNFLKEMNISSEVILDPVFYDNENNKNPQEKNYCIGAFLPKDFSLDALKVLNLQEKTVGISWRRGFVNNERIFLKNMIDYILGQEAKVVLLPHSFHIHDTYSNDYIFLKEFLRPGVTVAHTMEETYSYYQKNLIDMCISMRLHSAILSQSYNIAYISIQYAKKNEIFTQ